MSTRFLAAAWLVVAVALFVLIPGSIDIVTFWWRFAFPGDDGVGYALLAGPLDYLPLVWAVGGFVVLMVHRIAVRSR